VAAIDKLSSHLEPLRALPRRARCWWLGVLVVSISLVPTCFSQGSGALPAFVLVLAPLLNAGMVVATKPRTRQPSFIVSFDYGGIATVAMLAAFGPQAALVTLLGEKIARALTSDVSGRRPVWIKWVYNLAWGTPCILFSWWVRGFAPDPNLAPAIVAIAWWLSNGVLVGTMVALASRQSAREWLRLTITAEGWLRLQEGALSVLAVIAWWTNPLLLLAALLLVVGQAMTGRRLFGEYERSAAAHAEALVERRRAELEAELARLDPLTRLANRRGYEEAVDQQPACDGVLVLDLDHFKRVNDTFGHAVGDQVLVAVADVLRLALEPRAVVSRLGGEEFCALVQHVGSDEELFGLAESFRLAVSEVRIEGYATLRPTVSVGASRRRPYERTVRDAVTRADQALYAAKREGRNRTVLQHDDSTDLPLAS
jgi:diguanylate cyclase (GGDEF)-like protein